MSQTPPIQTAMPARPSGVRIPLLVGSLILSVLTFQLNASLLTPAIPAMARDFNVDAAAVSQVQSLFFLSGSVLAVVISRWSDAIGRRKALFVCLGMVFLGTVVTLLAPSLPLLLAGRALQGASSVSFTIAFLILSEELTAKQFGISVGVVTAVNGGLGGLDGFIGGAVTDNAGWRMLFVIILVVSVLATLGAIAFVPAHRRSEARRMDWLAQ